VPHGPVIRPRDALGLTARPAQAAPGRCPPEVRAALRPRAGAPAPPWHRPPPPSRACCLVAPRPQPIQDHLPGPVAGPAAMPVIDSLSIRYGRSRHGHPVRVRKKIPSITSRWSFHRCPCRGCRGSSGSSRVHSSSLRS
jgi:hypothetical protein